MDDVGDIGVDVVADFSGFEARMRAMLARMAKRIKVDVPVQVDTKAATKSMTIWRRLQAKALDVKVQLNQKSLALVSAQLASLTGVGQLASSFSHFNNTLLTLHERIIPIGLAATGMGAALGPLTVLLASLIISTVEFAQALGPGLGAALLALPGLLAAAAASMFVFQSAMKDATKVLGSAVTDYKVIRDIVSDNFWATAEDGVRGLLVNALEPLKTGFGTLATAMGSFTGRFASELDKVLTPGRIEGFFANIGAGFAILEERAAGPLANIAATLLEWGSTLVPRIADAVAGVAERFSAWLSNDGVEKLNGYLTNLGKLLQGIWMTISGFAGVLSGVAKAASDAGISAFPFAELMQRLSEIVNSPAFQTGLTAFFSEAVRGANGMLTAVQPLLGLLESLAPIIGKFLGDAGEVVGSFAATLFSALDNPKVLGNFQSMLNGFLAVIRNLEPAVQPFVEKLSEMMHFAGILADVVSQTLSVAIQELAPVVSTLLTAFEPLVVSIGNFIQQGLVQAGPAMQKIADAAAGLIGGINGFVEALQTPVIQFVLGLITDFFATAIAGALNLTSAIFQIVGGLLKLLSGDFSGLKDIWEGLKDGLLGAFQLFITLFAPAKLLKYIGGATSGILGLFAKIGQEAPKLIASGLGKLGGLVKEGLSALPGFFVGALVKIATSILPSAVKIGADIVGGITKGVAALIGGAISNLVDWLVDGVKSLLGIASPSTVFASIGGFLIQGLIQGIQALIQGVVTIFQTYFGMVVTVITTIFTTIQTVITTAWTIISTIITTAINLIVQGVQFYFNLIVTVIQTVLDVVKGIVEAGWNLLVSIFTTVLEAIVTAVTFYFDAVKAYIELVMNVISTVISTVWNAISSVIGTVLGFISSTVSSVMGTVQSIWSSAWNGISSVISSVVGGIKSTASGLFDHISSVVNNIKGLGGGIWDFLTDGLDAVVSTAKSLINSFISATNSLINGLNKVPGVDIPTIPKLARGSRYTTEGMTWVGERGPELVNMPRGAQVFTANRSRMMADQAANEGNGRSIVVEEGAIQIVSNDPYTAGIAVLDELIDRAV